MRLKKLHLSTLLLVAATIAFILSNILLDFDILQPLEHKVYDSVVRLRQREAATKVVVLAIDDHSIQQLGSWPWPRSYLAEMVKLLSKHGAHAMGISLLYPTREINPGLQELKHIKKALNGKPSKAGRKITQKINKLLKEAGTRLDHDAKLISAVRSAHNVVLPLRFSFGNPEDGSSHKLSNWLNLNSIELSHPPQDPNTLSLDSNRLRGIFNNNNKIQASRLTQPYLDLSKKAGALGHINLIGDHDGVVRKIPLLITYQDRDFISFALQVARKYRGGRLKQMKVVQDKIELGHLQIPTEKNHRMLIDYSGQDVNIEQVSFADALNGKVDKKMFRKKIVLLGVTAEGLTQQYNTPLGSNVSGLEIAAAAVENIINDHYISRPSWVFFLEILAVLYFAFFLLFVIPRVTPRMGAMILGIFLSTWVGASVILFISNGIWIKVLAPVILSAIGYSMATMRRDMTQKHDENVDLNKSLGLALQGQGMLDMAYEKFLKCPVEDKAVQKLLYNLGLDFERKRMLSKALSVYRHILKAGAFKDVKERINQLTNVVSSVAKALGYAHSRQVVHRDIKPANILHLDDSQIKVADFGIARVISSSKTQTGIIFGTPNYMSPEQVAGKKVDGRSDLFSLGVVFYELLSGTRPFKGDNMTALLYAVSKTEYVPLTEIAPKVPQDCVEIVERLLAKGVSQRYQSASQVIKKVQSCLDTLS